MKASLDLTVNDLAAKFRSKSELYNVLVREGGIYLFTPKAGLHSEIFEEYFTWSQIICEVRRRKSHQGTSV